MMNVTYNLKREPFYIGDKVRFNGSTLPPMTIAEINDMGDWRAEEDEGADVVPVHGYPTIWFLSPAPYLSYEGGRCRNENEIQR